MRNQLRAAFYLLSRSAWAKAAVVLPLIYFGFFGVCALLSPGTTIQQFPDGRDAIQTLLAGVTPVLACVLVAGVSAADMTSGGARMACCAERGRAGFVASRLVRAVCVAWAFSAYVLLLKVLLACVFGAPPPALPEDTLPRVASALLVIAMYAAITQLVAWVVRGTGRTLLALWLLAGVEFVAYAILLPVPGAEGPLVALRVALVHLLPTTSSALLSSGAQLLPLSSFVTPVLWIALATALSLRLWNRRNV